MSHLESLADRPVDLGRTRVFCISRLGASTGLVILAPGLTSNRLVVS